MCSMAGCAGANTCAAILADEQHTFLLSYSPQEEAASLRARLGRPAAHPASAVTAKRADLSAVRLAAARVMLEGLHEDRREREARLRSMLDLCDRPTYWPLCSAPYAFRESGLLRHKEGYVPVHVILPTSVPRAL